MTRIFLSCLNQQQITLPPNHVHRSCGLFDSTVFRDSVGNTTVVFLKLINEGPRMIPPTRMRDATVKACTRIGGLGSGGEWVRCEFITTPVLGGPGGLPSRDLSTVRSPALWVVPMVHHVQCVLRKIGMTQRSGPKYDSSACLAWSIAT